MGEGAKGPETRWRPREAFVPVVGRRAVDAAAVRVPGTAWLAQGGLAREYLERLPEAHALAHHHERDHVAAGAAAEAVPEALAFVDLERGRCFVVKGTEAPVLAS